MNSKKIQICLLLFFFVSGFAFISVCKGAPKLSAANFEWGIKEGDKITWVVSESNESKGFLPIGSKFELTITSIENASFLPGEIRDRIRADFSIYNSETKITTDILNNETFMSYRLDNNNTFFYDPFYQHGFFLPTNYYNGCAEGLWGDLYDNFGFNVYGYGFQEGIFTIVAFNSTTSIACVWEFNENFITETLTIYEGSLDNIEYLLVLDKTRSGSSIPLGNSYLLYFGITISAMIYVVYKKKFAR
ncbi:MAG: hypothetical protein ACFFA3_09320 [Promethearchaeota archaeon]